MSDISADLKVKHLAIIPDGNRRWARTQGIFGDLKMYDKGAEAAGNVIEAAFEEGVEIVSFWGGSESNLTARDKNEVKVLDSVYKRFAQRFTKSKKVHEQQVRVEVIGKWRELLSDGAVSAIQNMIDATKDYSNKVIVLLIGYDGVSERTDAINTILNNSQHQLNGNDLLRKHSWTGHLPDVDLVVRTGAWHDPHNSVGFLSLLTDNVQYSFPEVLWPDFNANGIKQVLSDFTTRERRYGK